MSARTVLNTPKLIVAVVAMIAVVVLAIFGKASGDAAIAVVSSVLAYMLGNGVAAATGKTVQPIFGRTRPEPVEPVELDELVRSILAREAEAGDAG